MHTSLSKTNSRVVLQVKVDMVVVDRLEITCFQGLCCPFLPCLCIALQLHLEAESTDSAGCARVPGVNNAALVRSSSTRSQSAFLDASSVHGVILLSPNHCHTIVLCAGSVSRDTQGTTRSTKTSELSVFESVYSFPNPQHNHGNLVLIHTTIVHSTPLSDHTIEHSTYMCKATDGDTRNQGII
jgi:hypothetical protein